MGSYTDGLFRRGRIRSQSNTKVFKTPTSNNKQERLVACGIIRDGVTHSYGFKSHGDIRRKLGDEDWSKSVPGDNEGFITSEDRFVSRDEANRIGSIAGQCVRMERKFLSSDVDKW
jgi:hypothetical protein